MKHRTDSGLRKLNRRRMGLVLAASTVALAVTLVGNAATSPLAGPLPGGPGGPGGPPPPPPPPPTTSSTTGRTTGATTGGGTTGATTGTTTGSTTGAATTGATTTGTTTTGTTTGNGQSFPDATGQSSTISLTGAVGANHPFFTPLGTNGRACVTCHQPSTGWTVTPQQIQQRFLATNGLDPIFRTVDGSNSPIANVSTVQARQTAYSMLLNHGDIRVGLPIPNGAEFTLAAVDDPYKFASASQLSLFRRPLPATNLRFLSTVMWDGRETAAGGTIAGDLGHQAVDAVLTHMQGTTAPSATTVNQIVAFESGLYSAQSVDSGAGALDAAPVHGGPQALSTQSFFAGINDPATSAFDPHVFNIYVGWAANTANAASSVQRRQSIARGEAIFNTRPFSVQNVGGLNDVLKRPVITLTCSTCHNAPNAGSHSVPMFLDLGLVAPVRRTPDYPLYTLKNKATGETRQVTDPGRALVTGKWADIGKFKIPTLRDLSARGPYFHDGSAQGTQDVIGFYDRRFNIGFTPQERGDLKAFLDSL